MSELVNISPPTRWLGRSYHYFESIGSTNVWLKENAASLPHGAIALTDFQSAGKGRLGRSWSAPPASAILHSYLLRPGWPAEQANWLTMIAALAVTQAAVALTNLPLALKWPNDLVLAQGGHIKKWGGILLEGDIADGRLRSAIVGIGLNVNIEAADLPEAATPATSLLVECGHAVSRRDLLLALLGRFEHHYDAAEQGQSPQPAWNRLLMTLGQAVTVTQAAAPPLTGTAEGTDPWGRLVVCTADGTRHTIAAADVTLRA